MATTQSPLHQQLDFLRDLGKGEELPDSITENLSEHIVLRSYQEDAFTNFLLFCNTPKLRKNKQPHLLFHMATGSGKTVMMAGLILHYYSQGYRNFLFFVNQTTVLEKTRANFLNPASGKYLFAPSIQIDGKQVAVREVDNFASPDPDAINLCFTTTQKLHYDLTFTKENSITVEDFEDDKTVLISDESHHVNTRTKKATKEEAEEDRSWEYSVMRIFAANRDNVLLEFTATADLRDKNIQRKYLDKIVFDYPLREFRESGYTKDFRNVQSGHSCWMRTLQALVMSEYRRGLFEDHGIAAKPVVLMKSQRIADSNAFYEEFFARLDALTPGEILSLSGSEMIDPVLDYFREQDATLQSLVEALRDEFSRERSLIMNGSKDNSTQTQLQVNSLEDPANPIRIVFTVDMLNEGWDVLNLYDIVRLYETRQGGKGGKPGPYTIKEAQLIGRGARYYPFAITDDQKQEPLTRVTRKYDDDVKNPLRYLETLLFHSHQDSSYISELRQALKETGLQPDDQVELTYTLKSDFMRTSFFHEALVFSNERVEIKRGRDTKLPGRIRSAIYQVHVASPKTSIMDFFEENSSAQKNVPTHTIPVKIKDIPLNIRLGVLARDTKLSFATLKYYLPGLKTVRAFLEDGDYLGDTEITFLSDHDQLTAADYAKGIERVLKEVRAYFDKTEFNYHGTTKFKGKRLSEVLRDKTIQVANPHGCGLGVPQSIVSDPGMRLDLASQDWYVYNDNYGTDQEKLCVKYFADIVPQLKERYEEVYLIRNERLAQLAIYSFDTGERFEPDFLLLLREKQGGKPVLQQIYVEPKGAQLIDHDKWKEDFLAELEEKAVPVKTYVDNTEYKIIGLPFFNADERMTEFRAAMASLLPAGQAG